MRVARYFQCFRINSKNLSNATVVGVVEDFHFQSMHHPIAPLVIHPQRYILSIYARIQGDSIPRALSRIEDAWKSAAPGVPFDFTFLDDQIEQQYRADQRWADIVELASGIVILITCMGLFGLATLATAKRSREVAIRKVLGAKVSEVTATLTKDFLKPVVLGLVIAFPLVYVLMHQWLNNFAYRIDMGTSTFILAAFLTLGIALLTVSWQAIRAALANPADSLRTE